MRPEAGAGASLPAPRARRRAHGRRRWACPRAHRVLPAQGPADLAVPVVRVVARPSPARATAPWELRRSRHPRAEADGPIRAAYPSRPDTARVVGAVLEVGPRGRAGALITVVRRRAVRRSSNRRPEVRPSSTPPALPVERAPAVAARRHRGGEVPTGPASLSTRARTATCLVPRVDSRVPPKALSRCPSGAPVAAPTATRSAGTIRLRSHRVGAVDGGRRRRRIRSTSGPTPTPRVATDPSASGPPRSAGLTALVPCGPWATRSTSTP